jgi:hypothetical protein
VKDSLTFGISAHHADDIQVEDLFRDVLVGIVLIPYGLEAVDPLLDRNTDPLLCPRLAGTRIDLAFILAIQNDLCTLVCLFVNFGDKLGIVPTEHHVECALVLGHSLRVVSILLD